MDAPNTSAGTLCPAEVMRTKAFKDRNPLSVLLEGRRESIAPTSPPVNTRAHSDDRSNGNDPGSRQHHASPEPDVEFEAHVLHKSPLSHEAALPDGTEKTPAIEAKESMGNSGRPGTVTHSWDAVTLAHMMRQAGDTLYPSIVYRGLEVARDHVPLLYDLVTLIDRLCQSLENPNPPHSLPELPEFTVTSLRDAKDAEEQASIDDIRNRTTTVRSTQPILKDCGCGHIPGGFGHYDDYASEDSMDDEDGYMVDITQFRSFWKEHGSRAVKIMEGENVFCDRAIPGLVKYFEALQSYAISEGHRSKQITDPEFIWVVTRPPGGLATESDLIETEVKTEVETDVETEVETKVGAMQFGQVRFGDQTGIQASRVMGGSLAGSGQREQTPYPSLGASDSDEERWSSATQPKKRGLDAYGSDQRVKRRKMDEGTSLHNAVDLTGE